jgi:hypothetical protein
MGDQDTLDKLVAEGGRRVPKREKAEIGKQARKLKEVSVNLSYAGMAVSFVKQKCRWSRTGTKSCLQVPKASSESALTERNHRKMQRRRRQPHGPWSYAER